MTTHRISRHLRAAAVAATVLAVPLALAPAAHAATVFDPDNTYLTAFNNVYTYGTGCTSNVTSPPAPANVPVVENGAAASQTTTSSISFANTGNPEDQGQFDATVSATGKVASRGGNVSSLDFTSSGHSTFTNSGSSCTRYAFTREELSLGFVVGDAGFLTIHASDKGNTYNEVYLYREGSGSNEPYFDSYGEGLPYDTDATVYLPAGTYSGYVETQVGSYSPTGTVEQKGTSTVHATFAVAGSRTAGPTGAGKSYVTLPASRTCAKHTVTPAVTGNAKRAKQVQSVTYYVDGHQVKQDSNPSAGDSVNLKLADDEAATVKAVATVVTRPGAPAKKLPVTASYAACTS